MKMIRKVLALVLALVLTMSVAAFPAAQADTAMKSEHGAFAAESAALGRIFMILPTEAGSTLYSMASNGGTVKMIEAAPQTRFPGLAAVRIEDYPVIHLGLAWRKEAETPQIRAWLDIVKDMSAK